MNTKIFETDAQNLAFADQSFDGVYTWAALEHVPDPDKALLEIDRILRSGGYALIAPAWNCRSWTVKKLTDRSYSELDWFESIGKALIPLREMVIFRGLVALPKRLLGELKLLGGTPISLRYKPLLPRWDLIEKFGHTSDDDAVADIDPHAAIIFFKSRGYDIISHKSLFTRLTARYQPVNVRKS